MALNCRVPTIRHRLLIWGGGSLLIVVTAFLAGWASYRDASFRHPGQPGPHKSLNVLSRVRAALPASPSFPGLPERTPVLVPGLEEVDSAFSPAFSSDLKTLVFSGTGNPNTGYDLYLSTRDGGSQPFRAPKLIRSCVSSDTDAYPTLSSDGLELVFVRSDNQPRLFRCLRTTIAEPFGEPEPLLLSDLAIETLRKERPQMIDGRQMCMVLIETSGIRNIHLFERPGPGASFHSHQPIKLWNPWLPYYFTAGGLRAYFGTSDGLFLSVRHTTEGMFDGEVQIGDRKITGPIDGPIWVTPNEDAIVYCSPGPRQKLGTARKLWMFQY